MPLYEIDVEGVKPPRLIMEKMGGLNGFEFGPDDLLYGPLWFKGQVAKVDVDKAELTVVADGFKIPAAVNFDSKGNLWVVDTALGQLVRVDPKTGARKMVAQLKPSLDNLAIDKDGISSPTWRTMESSWSTPRPARPIRSYQASWRCPAASASSPMTARTPSMSPTCSPIAPSMAQPAKSPSRPACMPTA
jgi:streptogramin lyase